MNICRFTIATVLAAFLPGCADVLGTSPFRECSGSECTAGSGGGGGGDASVSSTSAGGSDTASSSGSSGQTTSTGSAPACFDVTVLVNGDLRVRVGGSEITFEEESPGPFCLPLGPETLQAECHGEDIPVVTSWGNALCPAGGTTCSFDLQAPQSFSVSSSCGEEGGD